MININLHKEDYITDTLLELKDLSSVEVEEQLNQIREYTKDHDYPIYPFYEYVEDGAGNKVLKELDYVAGDEAKVANSIISRMFSYIAKEIFRLSNETGDLLEFCDWLVYLKNNGTNEEVDQALENFDRCFSYLENVPSYSSIYYKFRSSYLEKLNESLHKVYQKKMKEKEQDEYAILYSVVKRKYGFPRELSKVYRTSYKER